MSGRKKCLTIEEALALLEEESDDEESQAVKSSETVDFVYIPPQVDSVSDSEQFDDETIDQVASVRMDITGQVEINYEKESDDEADEKVADEIAEKVVAPQGKRRKTAYEKHNWFFLNIQHTHLTSGD